MEIIVRTNKNRLGVVAALAIVGVVVVGTGASAGAPRTMLTPESIPVPPGYQRIVDATSSITVSIPQSWEAHIEPAPYIGVFPETIAGTLPTIFAGPAGFTDDQAQLVFQAWPFDLHDEATGYLHGDYGVDCASSGRPYDDGLFVGYQADFTNCYGDAFAHFVSATFQDQFGVEVDFFSRTASDEAIFQNVLATFNWSGINIPQASGSGTPVQTGGTVFPFDE